MAKSNKSPVSSKPIGALSQATQLTSIFTSIKPTKQNFNPSTVKSTADAYELETGILSTSPEVILFTDFTPAFDDQGNLTRAGEILQAKQESLLISAASSIESLVSLETYSDLKAAAEKNRSSIKEFCDTFSADIGVLIDQIDNVKQHFNPLISSPIIRDENGVVNIEATKALCGGGIPIWGSSISWGDILRLTNSDIINQWTSTKLWVQSCLELKEILKLGAPTALLTDSTPVLPVSTTNNSPYKLSPAASENVSRFWFKDKLPLLADTVNIAERVSSNDTLVLTLQSFSKAFEEGFFNKPILSNSNNIDDSIARIAYTLCKEYKYSKFIKNNRQLLNTSLGYSSLSRNKFDIWDYIVGAAGQDITDISSQPLGRGNSMISLAQKTSTDTNTEILTFEDRYIIDDVGLARPGATMTPGTFYYLESAFDSATNSFDKTRIDSLDSNLKTIKSILDKVRSEALFSFINKAINFGGTTDPARRRLFTSVLKLSDEDFDSNDPKIFLSNPTILLQQIESRVLENTPILDRKKVRKTGNNFEFFGNTKTIERLWTNMLTPVPPESGGGFAFGEYQQTKDISWLLAGAALEDNDIKAMLFLYVMCKIDFTDNNQQLVASSKERLAKMLNYRLQIKYSTKSQLFFGKETAKVADEKVEKALSGQIASGTFILDKIALMMSELDDDDWFANGTNNTNYTGIDRIVFYAAFFELCLLMIKAASPEKIIGFVSVNSQEDFLSNLSFEELKKVVMSSSHVPGSYFVVERTSKEFVRGTWESNEGELFSYYDYDAVLYNSEESLKDDAIYSLRTINRFRGFINNLQVALSTLKSTMESQKYADFFNTASSILGDAEKLKSLMSREQLDLVRCKMADLSVRSDPDYSSPIKNIVPYFINLKDNPDLDLILPLEDTHLVSWNLWLKNYLKQGKFRYTDGFNKKIISVGLPQRLYRRLRVDASDITGAISKNGLIRLKVYRVDNLRTDLVHSPLSFIFDITKHPQRILKSYVESLTENDTEQKSFFNINDEEAPLPDQPVVDTNSNSAYSNFDFARLSSFEYPNFVTDTAKQEIVNNHMTSFLLEEYLQLVADTKFHEQVYFRSNKIEVPSNTIATASSVILNPSFNSFFLNETFFGDLTALKKSTIMPRKFDRVFHLIIDPDDFYIRKSTYQGETGTSVASIQKYLNRGDILVEQEEESVFYRRRRTNPNEITFDKYFVTIESFSENAVAS